MLPAHAGMVPLRLRPVALFTYAPRARGDGPEIGASAMDVPTCSPRTRGWSRDLRRTKGARAMLPAHAGMVPRRCGRSPPLSDAPRARGDGPDSSLCGTGTGTEVVSAVVRWTVARTARPDALGGIPSTSVFRLLGRCGGRSAPTPWRRSAEQGPGDGSPCRLCSTGVLVAVRPGLVSQGSSLGRSTCRTRDRYPVQAQVGPVLSRQRRESRLRRSGGGVRGRLPTAGRVVMRTTTRAGWFRSAVCSSR